MGVNDPFVLQEFASDLKGEDQIDLLADGGLYLTKELDAEMDLQNQGL